MDTTTTPVRTPNELITAVESGVIAFTGLLNDPYSRFKQTKEFQAYVAKDGMNNSVFLAELTKGKSALECAFLKHFFPIFKKSQEFKTYVASSEAADSFKTTAFDGTSKLYHDFLGFCKSDHCDEILEYLRQFRDTIRKSDNYHEFMILFNATMKNVHDMNINTEELKTMHKKYWDSKKNAPKDFTKLKKDKEVAEPKPSTQSRSNSDPTNEKEKADEQPSKKEQGGEVSGSNGSSSNEQQSGRKKRIDKVIKPGMMSAPEIKDVPSHENSGSNSDQQAKKKEGKKEKAVGKS